MVNPRERGNRLPSKENPEILDLRRMIAAEVGEFLHEILPGLLEQMKQELIQVVNSSVEAVMAARANVAGSPRSSLQWLVYVEFLRLKVHSALVFVQRK